MYSYADRIRAVALYIKLGLRVRATIRQLGYPTKNALKGKRSGKSPLTRACGGTLRSGRWSAGNSGRPQY